MSKRQPKTCYWQDAPYQRDQLVLFQDRLEDRIPDGHPVRLVDEVLSGLDWSEWESGYNGRRGQPPIHPRVMCGVLLFALIRRVRSSRQIEYALEHSIDFIWLASGRVIDHSTLSAFRRQYPREIKDVYRQLVQVAVDLGVAKLSELCIDGTKVLADANRHKTLTVEKVEQLLADLGLQIDTAMSEMECHDEVDDLFDDSEETGQTAARLPAELQDMKFRQAQLNKMLAQLREMEERRKSSGQKTAAQIPVTDPDSRILPNKEGGYAPNYTPMAITESENGFIVGADVLVGQAEGQALLSMVDAVGADFGEETTTLMADGAYSTGPNIQAMEEREIEFLSPLPDSDTVDNPAIRDDLTQPVVDEELERLPRDPRTKRFSKQAFVYVSDSDSYFCPAGRELVREGTTQRNRNGATILLKNYRCPSCDECPLLSLCRTVSNPKKGRKLECDGFDDERERHREHMRDPDSQERYKKRQHIGETPFAVLKTVFDFRRFLLRGHPGVQTEWLWVCSALNLKKLIAIVARLRANCTSTNLAVIN